MKVRILSEPLIEDARKPLLLMDMLKMAERGEPIPQEALAALAPQDLVAIHRKIIEGWPKRS